MRYCIYCGVEIPADAKYCQICGKEQPVDTISKIDNTPEEKTTDESGLRKLLNSPPKIIAAGIGAFLILMIILTGIMLLFL